jgi:hypothetical protein
MKEGDNEKKKEQLTKPSQPIMFNGKVAEEVGFDKIRKQLAQLEELRFVILDGLCMWRPEVRLNADADIRQDWLDGATDIKDACPKTFELDLSRNLFEEWREVAAICDQLDHMTSLRVDGTRFRDTTLTHAERERCLKTFANIKTLKLENDLLPWEDVTRITHMFPSLTTFSAASNFYSALTPSSLNHTITDLTLEENAFSSLSALQPLTALPNLQRLILKQNNISEITSPGQELPVFPATVTEVDLSFNEITTWSFIEALQHVFPGLTSLRVSHNPLYTSLHAPDGRALSPDDGYMLTLARLGNLVTLNHSPITSKERLNAESYYLSLITREVQFAPESQRDAILATHPRFAWLCDEYGAPNLERAANAVNPNSLAARLLRITFRLAPVDGAAEPGVFETEIPMGCTAYTVLGIVGRHFGIEPIKCKLVWETGDWMPASRTMADVGEEDWDSEGSDGEGGQERMMREVEIMPGTRSVGTWIDGLEATVRVEVR